MFRPNQTTQPYNPPGMPPAQPPAQPPVGGRYVSPAEEEYNRRMARRANTSPEQRRARPLITQSPNQRGPGFGTRTPEEYQRYQAALQAERAGSRRNLPPTGNMYDRQRQSESQQRRPQLSPRTPLNPRGNQNPIYGDPGGSQGGMRTHEFRDSNGNRIDDRDEPGYGTPDWNAGGSSTVIPIEIDEFGLLNEDEEEQDFGNLFEMLMKMFG